MPSAPAVRRHRPRSLLTRGRAYFALAAQPPEAAAGTRQCCSAGITRGKGPSTPTGSSSLINRLFNHAATVACSSRRAQAPPGIRPREGHAYASRIGGQHTMHGALSHQLLFGHAAIPIALNEADAHGSRPAMQISEPLSSRVARVAATPTPPAPQIVTGWPARRLAAPTRPSDPAATQVSWSCCAIYC